MSLSVIIITKNEAATIEACLQSVKFADEIIVLDSNSQDDTVPICKKYTANVYVTEDWPGFGAQKARALQYVTKEWVLVIDADERIPEALQKEIVSKLPTTTYDGFNLRFSSKYCGRFIRYGDWYNEKHLRLFRRSKGGIVPHLVHCRVDVKGTVGLMQNPVLHESFPDLSAVLYKMNLYSSTSAQQKFAAGQQASLGTAITHGIWAFIRGYFIRGGFLDGAEGFMLAVSNAEGTYYRYLKLRHLWLKQNQAKELKS